MSTESYILAFILIYVQFSPGISIQHELKVHNIILYPERHSWCKTTPIQQVITVPGYTPKTIENHICVGACYSYSIPGTNPAEPGELLGPYCDSCQPVTTKCYQVSLNGEEESPGKTIHKQVEIIQECTCLPCQQNLLQQEQHDNNLCHSTPEETPDILPTHFYTNLTGDDIEDNIEGNHQDSIDNGLSVTDLLNMHMKSNTTTSSLSINLREILARLNHTKILRDNRNNNNISGHHRHKVGDVIFDQTNRIQGHLVKGGPHGSLILKQDTSAVFPVGIQEKFNIQDHVLKPNHDGVVITYETQENPNTDSP